MPDKRWMALGLIWLGLGPAPVARAADWEPITDAEKSMKTNPIDPGAGAIVLFKKGTIRVQDATTIETYTRIKILSEAGRDAANVSVEANKYRRLSKVEGRTVLPSGRIIPLDSSQIHRGRTYESGRGYAIFRISFAFPSVEPGAIIEYQTVENSDWDPATWIFDEPGLATLKSTLTVVVAPPLAMAQFPVDTTRNKIKAKERRTAIGWEADYEVDDLFPVRNEPYAMPFRDQAAMVIFSPYQFGSGPGSVKIIQSWDDVAKRINGEFRYAEQKAKQTKEKAREIAGNLAGERAKAEAIYRFIQQNVASTERRGVRLDSAVDDVLSGKGGDPDEINALFITMLREVKIDADPVVLAARNWQTLVGKFPSMSQFSHLITRLNFKQGPAFADPGDPASAFGELPWYEWGIGALAIKGNKAEPLAIPLNLLDDNLTQTKLSSELKPGWKVESQLEIAAKGLSAAEMRREMLGEAPEKLDQRLTESLSMGLPEAAVADVAHPDFKDAIQPLLLKARVQHELVEEGGPGERLLNPWVGDRYESPVFKATERFSVVEFRYPEKRESTSTWRLPPGVRVERLPQEVRLANDLGEFSHDCTQQGETVTCTRSFALKKMLLKGMDEYRSAKQFFEDVSRHDQEVMVLHEK